MSKRAFIDAIKRSPGDDTPRLVYADYLDEIGDSERAEFIRAQIEEAAIPFEKCDCIYPGCSVWDNRVVQHDHKCRGYDLVQRQIALISGENYYRWRGIPKAIDTNDVDARFRRGFIHLIVSPLALLLEHGPAICADNPVTSVRVTDREPMNGNHDEEWIWFDDDFHMHTPGDDADELPSEIVRTLDDRRLGAGTRRYRVHKSRSDAMESLSAAVLVVLNSRAEKIGAGMAGK